MLDDYTPINGENSDNMLELCLDGIKSVENHYKNLEHISKQKVSGNISLEDDDNDLNDSFDEEDNDTDPGSASGEDPGDDSSDDFDDDTSDDLDEGFGDEDDEDVSPDSLDDAKDDSTEAARKSKIITMLQRLRTDVEFNIERVSETKDISIMKIVDELYTLLESLNDYIDVRSDTKTSAEMYTDVILFRQEYTELANAVVAALEQLAQEKKQ